MKMAARSSSFSSVFGSIGGEDNSLQNKQMLLQQFSSTTTTTTTTTTSSSSAPTQAPPKKRRNQPGNPNPDSEIVALSPRTLVATNRFICEVCNKGFQREQNLQLHRRGHNLPWKLKQKSNKEVIKKKVYVCPEPTCVHHDPSRALGDLTGIKKHYFRKHGEKKWKCDKCSKRYAVQSDWKAHSKTCGTREHRCDCGTLFSRRDSFITHRAFCDALTRETTRNPSSLNAISSHLYGHNANRMNLSLSQLRTSSSHISSPFHHQDLNNENDNDNNMLMLKQQHIPTPTANQTPAPPFFLQDTAQLGFHQDHQHQPAAGHNIVSFASKPLHHHLLQTNTNDLFNLGFFKGHSSSTSTHAMNTHVANVDDQGNFTFFSNNVAAGASTGFSSLFNPNLLPHDNSTSNVHTSATALLQKAAQIGSNPSANNSTTLLGSLATSTSSNNLAGGQHVESNHDNNLQGFMNSFVNGAAAAGSNNIFVGAGQVQNGNPTTGYNINANFDENFDEAELRRNLGLSIGGSDRLTLDFLGVGGMVRNVGINPEASFSRRESLHLDVSVSNSSLDTEMKSSLASNPFGGD